MGRPMRTFLADTAPPPQGRAENVLIEMGPSGNMQADAAGERDYARTLGCLLS